MSLSTQPIAERARARPKPQPGIAKVLTGISGLDELTAGGPPRDAAGFVTGSAREAQQRHDAANGGGGANNGAKKSLESPSPS
jgi:hypothetical protein